jgi:hypothetical protein
MADHGPEQERKKREEHSEEEPCRSLPDVLLCGPDFGFSLRCLLLCVDIALCEPLHYRPVMLRLLVTYFAEHGEHVVTLTHGNQLHVWNPAAGRWPSHAAMIGVVPRSVPAN